MQVRVLGGPAYARPFKDMGYDVYYNENPGIRGEMGFACTPDDNLIVFTGGEDVSPSLYGQEPHPATHSNMERDRREIALYRRALYYNIPMVGICRGSQFLNVMNGGTLFQHQTEHAGPNHTMYTNEDREIEVTSTHHQMSWISPQARLLAWAEECWDGNSPNKEPEVFYYPLTQCLCVQYHPEYMPEDSEGYKYFIDLIEQLLYKECW